MTDEEMKKAVTEKVYELLEKFSEVCNGESNIFMPEILFTLKGNVSGRHTRIFATEHHILNFNLDIMRNNWDIFIERTPVHEVAHFCSFIKYGDVVSTTGRRKIHGLHWKRVMMQLGAKDIKRCHNYKTSNNRQQNRFHYTCDCNYHHSLSTTLHNKIRYKGELRSCGKCNSVIKFVEMEA